MLCDLRDTSWNQRDWIWETKYDGVRAIVNTGTGNIHSRSGKDKTANFPEIRPETLKPAILDGEIVSYANGISDFNSIQHRATSSDLEFRQAKYPAEYEVFDIIELDGQDVTRLPLIQRKELLEAILVPSNTVHLAGHTDDGVAAFALAVARSMEGIVGKNLNHPYMQNARGWVKVKRSQIGQFKVVGYTAGTGWRSTTFGALVLADMGHDDYVFIGEVGTGFNDKAIQHLMSLMTHSTPECQFSVNPYSSGNQPTWIENGPIVKVKYLEFTNDNKLRFPVFTGIKTEA